MKKLLSLLLSITLVLSLTACGGGTASSAENNNSASPQPSSETAAPSETGEAAAPSAPSETVEAAAPAENSQAAAESEGASALETPAEPAEEAGGTLIAYFSWSGNTEQMAQMIQAETGGTLFKIEPATPYTDDYDTLLDVARQEQADNARPELASQVEDWDSYDVVFVGYPDWWSDAPMLIYSFLEAYDWAGKTLVPFCTSGGSGFGQSLDQLPESAPGATILEGLHVSGSSVDSAGEDISAWIDGLNLA